MAYNYGFQLGLQEGKNIRQAESEEKLKRINHMNIALQHQQPKIHNSYNHSREKSPVPIVNNMYRNGSHHNLIGNGIPKSPKEQSLKMGYQQRSNNIPFSPRPPSANKVGYQNANQFFGQYPKKY